MTSFEPKDCTIQQMQALLSSAVAPRPIAFASTIDAKGHPNLSPFSFFNIFSTNPPILIFSPARRVRDNTTKHTLHNVQEVMEVVINVVHYNMIQQMSLSSTEYAKDINEFEKAGLTMLKSDVVRPFRVAESPIQMECKVNEIKSLGTENGAGNLVICEVLKLHVSETVLNTDGSIDQEKLDLVARGGGSYYIRAKDGFLEIPKPLKTLGIGVDALPQKVRQSSVLTGNDLGVLGNVEALPDVQKINDFWRHSMHQNLKNELNTTEKTHLKAKEYLQKGQVQNAWCVLLK
ncbi:flavin reductase family protein [Flavobacteriaceae bacterium]|nr:flavin reductase family protein [Flavobacteriaceae bacterium]MDB2631719.1 flavin reductase family protein [Flavobacteriaceae bacterium]